MLILKSAIAIVVVAIVVVACGRKEIQPQPGESVSVSGDAVFVGNMRVYTDSLTGCQYLGHSGESLTPRMDADGKQICGVHQ